MTMGSLQITANRSLEFGRAGTYWEAERGGWESQNAELGLSVAVMGGG